MTSRPNEAQALEHLLLGDLLVGVEDEVDEVDAGRLPLLQLADDLLGVADGDALGRLAGARPGWTPSDGWRPAGRATGSPSSATPPWPCRAGRRGTGTCRSCLPPVSTPVAESSWQNRKLAEASWSLTKAPAGVQFWMRRRYSWTRSLLRLERREVHAERAHAAVGGVELGAGRRHGHPHRRVRLLVRLGQHGPGRHREELALVAEALLHPHLRDGVDELVPRLLRRVGVGAGSRRARSTWPTDRCRTRGGRRRGCRARRPARRRGSGG